MIMYYRSNKLETLCKFCNIPFTSTVDSSILFAYICSGKEQLVETIELFEAENSDLKKKLTDSFKEYQPKILQQEQFLRQNYKDLYIRTIGEKDLALNTQIKIRKYQNEVKNVINQYEDSLSPLYQRYRTNHRFLTQNNNILKDMDHFRDLISLICQLADFEGSSLVFDWYILIISTSGLHLVYNQIPNHLSEDTFRNMLYEGTLEFFKTYFGKKTNVLIEIYNLEQYRLLNFENLPDKLDYEELILFSNIVVTKSFEVLI